MHQTVEVGIFQRQVGRAGPLIDVDQRHDVRMVDLPDQYGLVVQKTPVLVGLRLVPSSDAGESA